MKKGAVAVLALVLVSVIPFVAVASADCGSGWSDPVEIVSDATLDNPQLYEDNALWVMYEQYPSFGVARTDDGALWSKYRERDPLFGGYYSDPRPVAVTPHDMGDEALHFEVLRVTSGNETHFRDSLRIFDSPSFGGGGSTWVTEMEPYLAHWRYNAVGRGGDHHIVWRNYYTGAIQYIRLGDHGLYASEPVTVTAEFQEGGAPALYVGQEKIVVIVDDADSGFQNHQSWAYISRDGGQTWSGKIFVGNGAHPRIAKRGGELVVLLQSGGTNRIMSFVSADTGGSWEGPYYLQTGDFPELNSLTVSDNTAAVVWCENNNIYAGFSRDGKNWNRELVFSSVDQSISPDIAVWRRRVYVVWKEAVSGSGVERILIASREIPPYKLFIPITAKNM